MRRRLVICDPVCVLAYGHNASAMNHFSRFLSLAYTDVVQVGGVNLPVNLPNSEEVKRHFRHYYYEQIPIPRVFKPSDDLEYSLLADPQEAMATEDMAELLAQLDVDRDDDLFFPSADFYGVVGLLNALQSRSSAPPRIFVRFIGVMEFASEAYRDPEHELISRLRAENGLDGRISCAAETPTYADYLSERLDTPVFCASYPEVYQQRDLDQTDGEAVRIYCPGSPRLDKGYLDLMPIISEVRRNDPQLKIRFVVHHLLGENSAFDSYTSQLYALPGVEMIAGYVEEERILSEYHRCSAVLLPYDRAIYRLRGSAVMMEALAVGRPVLTYNDTAFANQVLHYGNGSVYSDRSAMVQAILALPGKSIDAAQNRINQARKRYMIDSMAGYAAWFQAPELMSIR